ncbi:unnamed protein product [Moneuplotes crassus]|uniref:Uncharacterized protein n=1 Tax=Euplotes crassus TaxID=5936 RepID=A0AAD1XI76_EUPCR|nr:unnamed protein product [Moneuplotes crassus]
MKVLSILIAAGLMTGVYFAMSGSSVDEVELAFGAYTTEFNKNYQSEEEYNFRKNIFEANLKTINEHNAKGVSFTMGTNAFTDWTDEEYKRMLGYKSNRNTPQEFRNLGDLPTNCKNLPRKSIDWRDEGIVTDVKNQGACGSCWAFAAVGSLEGAYAKTTGDLVSFSESQLVECDKFSHGCSGGLMFNGFNHWMRNSPRTEEDYPYPKNAKPGKCSEDKIPSDYPLLEWGYRVDITWECLYEALTHNVVSVAIRAENDPFRHYSGGIIDDDESHGIDCGTDLDHGVTLVGYDADEDAWIVKNSWGAGWGENGFVRIRRGEGMGVCGINQENSQAVYDDSEYRK